MVSAKVKAAIMQKCTQEEVQAVLKEIPDDESDQAVATRVSTFVDTYIQGTMGSFLLNIDILVILT